MAVQTSVLTNFPAAFAGDPRGDIYGENNRMAEVAINPGLFVCQGTRDEQCKLPTSSAEVAKGIGIARSNVSRDTAFPSSGATYPIGDVVSAVSRGQVWVLVEEAVTPMSAVYVRYDTGSGGSQKGAFRASADTSTAAAVTGARYLTTAGIGALALVDLNLPQ